MKSKKIEKNIFYYLKGKSTIMKIAIIAEIIKLRFFFITSQLF